MKNKEQQTGRKLLFYFSMLAIGVVICFFLGENGPILGKDSVGFLEANAGVESAYGLYVYFLRFCKMLFGEKKFLYGVYFCQSCLAIITSICLTEYIRKQYELNEIGSVIVYIFSFLPYMYSLPENVVTHHILTEALAIPLMTLFFLFSMKAFLEKRMKNMFLLGGVTALLMLTRSQLRLLFVVYLGMWLFIFLQKIYGRIVLKDRKYFWGLLGGVCIVGVFICVAMLRFIVSINAWPQLTDAVAGRTLCTIDYEDRELFNDKDRELFDYIYQIVDERQYREPYFRNDTWRGHDIANASNENVKIYYDEIGVFCYLVNPGINAGPMQDIIAQARVDFITTLFPEHIWEYMLMTIELLPQSYVSSIFIQPDSIHEICYYIAAILYFLGVIFIIYCYRKKVAWKYCIPMIVTLYTISLNNIFTNLLFYGQQRYVIYSFGAFYISAVLLILGIYRYRINIIKK